MAAGLREKEAVDQAADGVAPEYDGFLQFDKGGPGQPMGLHQFLQSPGLVFE